MDIYYPSAQTESTFSLGKERERNVTTNEYYTKWFKSLEPDDMSNVIHELSKILNARRNYGLMDVEVTETFTIWPDIIKLNEVRRLLIKVNRDRRWVILRLKQHCTIWPKNTKYFRLLSLTSRAWSLELTYQPPRRGDLSIICRKVGISVSEYRAGIVWTYLRQVIEGCMRPEYQGSLEFTTLEDGFLINGLQMRSVMRMLSQVCKEWYVVLKYYCVWWGPRGMFFALAPSPAASMILYRTKPSMQCKTCGKYHNRGSEPCKNTTGYCRIV